MTRQPGDHAGFSDQNGAAAVETAIVLPALIIFVFGIFHLGWAIYCGSDVRHALERASRVYIADRNAADGAFLSAVGAHLETVRLEDVSVTIARERRASGAELAKVQWVYRHDLVVPFLPARRLTFGSTMTIPLGPS